MKRIAMTSNLPAMRGLAIGRSTGFSYDEIPTAERQARAEANLLHRVVSAYRRLGYIVHQGVVLNGIQLDLVIEDGPKKTPVEISGEVGSGQIDKLRREVLRLVTLRGRDAWTDTPVIIVTGFATPVTAHWARHQTEVRIIRLDDLEAEADAQAPPNPDFAPLSAEDLEQQRAQARLAERETLIARLRAHDADAGVLTPTDYEGLGKEVFRFLFDPSLFGFESQTGTSDGANRYDFICRIATDRAFWSALKTDFRTRAILFECKNYTDPITADQIYSTERYLFSSALRTVCFLIARKGGDDSCQRAAQGAMRESGKLILVLSNLDLIEMLEFGDDIDSAENHLDVLIWRFIISLPR
jgi:hypothetical protein